MTDHPALNAAVSQLIETYGLSAVYYAVRRGVAWADGFCPNCGTPLEDGSEHIYGSMGSCWIGPPPDADLDKA